MARYEISRGVGIIDVRAKPGHRTRGLLVAGNLVLECALGKGNQRFQARRRRCDASRHHAAALWIPPWGQAITAVVAPAIPSCAPSGRVVRCALRPELQSPGTTAQRGEPRGYVAARRSLRYLHRHGLEYRATPARMRQRDLLSSGATGLYAYRRLHSIEARRYGAPPASSDGPDGNPRPQVIRGQGGHPAGFVAGASCHFRCRFRQSGRFQSVIPKVGAGFGKRSCSNK